MRILLLVVLLVALCTAAVAADPVVRVYRVDGIDRSALVFPGVDAARGTTPVILAFHGFGETPEHMARLTQLHQAWPQATVVYPMGSLVNSPMFNRTGIGWQATPPARGRDNDVRFVEKILATDDELFRIDPRRIYVTGMSNGAEFAYLLLTYRPKLFAAFAPVAGASAVLRNATEPRPVLIIQGARDRLVKVAWAEAARDRMIALNRCGTHEAQWAPGYVSYQPCPTGAPVIWRLHDGGHLWPRDASAQIVRFFREFTP